MSRTVLVTGGARGIGLACARRFAELGDRIHEAVLIHTEGILYSNRQFASFLGVDRVDLVGRRLEDLVAPEYAELVADTLRRRMTGEAAAERFEVEIVGMQGQVSLLNGTARALLGAERARVGTSLFAALERGSVLAAVASAAGAGFGRLSAGRFSAR